MAKGKDYSTGNGKRWLVAVGLVVLVAIIVVVILLCIPPNTYNAIETLNRSAQTTFLKNEQEDADLRVFSQKLKDNQRLHVYTSELDDVRIIAESVSDILDFYNSSLVFASSNKNFKKNYKPIKNNLNSAKSSQKKLASILNDLTEVAVTSSSTTTALSNGMIDFRREFVKWLKYNRSAISALGKSYTGSMGNILENNEASKIIINATNDYLDVLVLQLEKVAGEDKKDNSTDDYNYVSSSVVRAFENFVDTYLTNVNSGDITSYYFDSNVQAKYEKTNKFTSLYKEDNYQKIIASAKVSEGKILFDYAFDNVSDPDGVYAQVKEFLGGNL